MSFCTLVPFEYSLLRQECRIWSRKEIVVRDYCTEYKCQVKKRKGVYRTDKGEIEIS